MEDYATIDQVASVAEAQADTQEKVDAIGSWFDDACIQTDIHECYCTEQDQTHPILIGEDDAGTTTVKLWDKEFTPEEIIRLQTVHEYSAASESTYAIFQAIDAKTRACGYEYGTYEMSSGDIYEGQVEVIGTTAITSGIGKYGDDIVWTMATFSDAKHHGFSIKVDLSTTGDTNEAQTLGEYRDDEAEGFLTYFDDVLEFLQSFDCNGSVCEHNEN